jgi:hypothetical protein
MAIDAEELCSELLKLDISIRFVGIANEMGRLVAAKFREGLQPLLTSEELQSSVIKAALRMKTREDYEPNLGRTLYTFTSYEKVKRVSISLDDSRLSLLMASFDITADHNSIILNKILPRIKQHQLISEA